jgi:ATP-dependent RNA circularization protein (DNA/RNA ligase family)
MSFKKYPKVHRLGKEETEGILEGEVHIEEKIDGSNVSIWFADGELQVGTRNQRITEGFNGFVDFVRNHPTLPTLFERYPHIRLYGEWLVKHTIAYKETSYKQFYLFDVTSRSEETDGDEEAREEFWPRMAVHQLAKDFDLKVPEYHGSLMNPTMEDIMPFVGKSSLGEEGEGVVLKNPVFRDKFGNHNYAKIVTEKFKENNGVTFGGNNKHPRS